MKKYVFKEYRNCFGIGSEKIFATKKEAISYADSEWFRLARADKESYIDDVSGTFSVYEIEITPGQLAEYENGDADFTLPELWTADIWNALVKRVIESTEFHSEKPWGDVWDTAEVVEGADAYCYGVKDFLSDNMSENYEIIKYEYSENDFSEYLEIKYYDDIEEKERIFVYRSEIKPLREV